MSSLPSTSKLEHYVLAKSQKMFVRNLSRQMFSEEFRVISIVISIAAERSAKIVSWTAE